MKINPRLVITHVSGYGQEGHPDYLNRASYDFIGQAFGGMMNLTGFPDPEPPVRAVPWTGDYITALFCLCRHWRPIFTPSAPEKGRL